MTKISELVSSAVDEIIKTGTTSTILAKSLTEDYWARLSTADKKELVTLGLSMRINLQLANERRRGEPTANVSAQKLVHRSRKEQAAYHDQLAMCSREHGLGMEAKLRCLEHTEFKINKLLQEGLSKEDAFAKVRNEHWQSSIESRDKEFELLYKFQDEMQDILEHFAIQTLKQVVLKAADGSMRSLLEFGQDDVEYWKQTSAVREASWAVRKEWFSSAEELLKQESVTKVSELSFKNINKLAGRAYEIWVLQDRELSDEERVIAGL